jgi:hypothetical protein
MAAGALVVDTRPTEQRERDGELPGAVVIDRNVLERRLDPTSPQRLPEVDRPDRRVIVVCNEGFAPARPRPRGATSACAEPPTSSAATRRGAPLPAPRSTRQPAEASWAAT